jgi:hypothetical protein
MYEKDIISKFINQWLGKYPIDYWWRNKHKETFNSSLHRQICFIDMLIEYEEEKMKTEELENKIKGMEVAIGERAGLLEANKGLTVANSDLQKALDTCASDLTIANEKKIIDRLTTGELLRELLNRLLRKK